MSPSPDLYRAIGSSDWTTARSILSLPSAKIHLSYCGRGFFFVNNWTSLHWACFRRNTPLDIIQSILSLCPSMALAKDSTGAIPLHIANRYSSDEIRVLLINSCPEATQVPDEFGHIPLQRALTVSRSLPVIKALMSAAQGHETEMESASRVLSYGNLPSKRYFRKKWNMGIRMALSGTKCSVSLPVSVQKMIVQNEFGQQFEMEKLYDEFSFLVRACALHQVKDSDRNTPFLIVHTTLEIESCPWSFFSLALRVNPEQAWQEDDDGNLPLHIASVVKSSSDGDLYVCEICGICLKNTPWYQYDQFWAEKICENCFPDRKPLYYELGEESEEEGEDSENDKESKEEHEDSEDESEEEEEEDRENWKKEFSFLQPIDKIPEAINELLAVNSNAASIPNRNGRLPLNLAIEAKKPYGKVIEVILRGSPRAHSTRDLATHIYPFMLAAVGNDEKDKSSNHKSASAERVEVVEANKTKSRQGNGEIVCDKEKTDNNKNEEVLGQFTSCFNLLMENPNLIRGKIIVLSIEMKSYQIRCYE